VLGVLPFDPAVQLEEEDSLGLPADGGATGPVTVAVLRLPGLSNFTDFAVLGRSPEVAVRYVVAPDQLAGADLIVLPGTRTTMRALDWVRQTGLAGALEQAAAAPDGPLILGLCGGYQLLGRGIADPDGVESAEPFREGLGLLQVDTVFERRKLLCRVEGEVTAAGSPGHGCPVVGYEVHQGRTRRRDGVQPWLRLRRQPGGAEVEDGAVAAGGRVCGTYVHGLFDDARFCRALVDQLRQRRGLPPLTGDGWLSQASFWERRYQGLGAWLQAHCDLRPVAAALGLAPSGTVESDGSFRARGSSVKR
jgi:adenosylcobyric acid synthase